MDTFSSELIMSLTRLLQIFAWGEAPAREGGKRWATKRLGEALARQWPTILCSRLSHEDRYWIHAKKSYYFENLLKPFHRRDQVMPGGQVYITIRCPRAFPMCMCCVKGKLGYGMWAVQDESCRWPCLGLRMVKWLNGRMSNTLASTQKRSENRSDSPETCTSHRRRSAKHIKTT